MHPTYKSMLQKMQEKSKKRSRRIPKDPWVLYILQCSDGTFYTGIAKDLEKRFQAHNQGKGAKYTRTRRPVTILYQESCANRTEALVRECAVKALPRQKKEKLINP